jgi:hypothetical protein
MSFALRSPAVFESRLNMLRVALNSSSKLILITNPFLPLFILGPFKIP